MNYAKRIFLFLSLSFVACNAFSNPSSPTPYQVAIHNDHPETYSLSIDESSDRVNCGSELGPCPNKVAPNETIFFTIQPNISFGKGIINFNVNYGSDEKCQAPLVHKRKLTIHTGVDLHPRLPVPPLAINLYDEIVTLNTYVRHEITDKCE